MEELSGYSIRVWPVAAGSWALQNELTWLESHSDVVGKVNKIFFVVNSGDFGAPSSWRCETTHPTKKPLLATLYLFRKHIWDWSFCTDTAPPNPVPDRDWRPRLRDLISSPSVGSAKIVFFLYPDKNEFYDKNKFNKWSNEVAMDLKNIGVDNIVKLFDDHDIPDSFYRDDIHPSSNGTALLAKILLEKVQKEVKNQ